MLDVLAKTKEEVQTEPRRSKELFTAVMETKARQKLIDLLDLYNWDGVTLDTANPIVGELCQAVAALKTPLLAESRAAVVAYHEQYAAAEAAYQCAVAVYEAEHARTLY